MRDKTQGWIAKVIIGVILAVFALFGFENFVGGNASQSAIEVNGEQIPEQEIQRAVQNRQQQLIEEMGEHPDPAKLDEGKIRKEMVDSLIQRRLLSQYADKLNIRAPAPMVDQAIISEPQLQVDGKYDPARVEALLAQAGLSIGSYRQMLASDLKLGQLQSSLILSNFSTKSQKEHYNALFNQVRKVSLAAFPASDYQSKVSLSDADLSAWYEKNKDRFKTAEQIRVAYLVVDPEALAKNTKVPEAALRTAYDARIKEMRKDVPTGKVWHILLTGDDAETRANALLKQLEAQPSNFEADAKRESQDTTTADAGGLLRDFEPGFLGADFDAAVAGLKPGQLAAKPIKSDFGWHIVRMTAPDHQPALPTFEAMRPELESQLAIEQSRSRLQELNTRLGALSFENDTLEPVAKALGLSVQQSDWLTRSRGGEGLSSDPRFLAAAFGEEVLGNLNSEPLHLDKGVSVVMHKLAHQPAAVQPYAAVKEQVRQAAFTEQALVLAQKDAEFLVNKAKEGIPLGEVLPAGQSLEQVDLRRDDTRLPAALVEAVFELPKPASGKPQVSVASGDESAWLVSLNEVSSPSLETADARMLTGMIDMQNSMTSFALFGEGLKKQADIQSAE